MSFLPPRSLNRYPAQSTVWAGKWKLYLIPVIMSGFLLQILFLGNMSYLYGALFKSGSRMHNLKILAVDLMLAERYYPTPGTLREAVCKHGYWGAIYTNSGATDKVLAAIEGDNTTTYDASAAMTYIYNGIYYPAIVASLRGSLQSLVSATSTVFPLISSDAIATVNITNPASTATFVNPISATAWDIMPTSQGVRVLLNTVSMIMPILMQFFFIMAVNAVTANAKVLETQSKRDVYIFRLCASKIYGCISSLCMCGYIWAFRETWGVTAGQFFETWMCLWLYMDINYMVVDTIIGTIIPMSFFAYFFLTWVILNIATVVYPFDLTPGFYHWGWALPAHSIWFLLVSIWSNGCRALLDVTLPILFAWWFVGHFTSAWSVRRRCLMAEAESKLANNTDKFTGYQIAENPQSTIEMVSSRSSGQENNNRTSDNYDVESNRSVSLPVGSDSRIMINALAQSQDADAAKEQRQ